MTDTPSRLFALACVLVGVWVVTYWLYEPSHGPKVTLDPRDAAAVAIARQHATSPPPDAQPKPVTPNPGPGPNSTPQPRKVQKVIAPEFREYMVQKDDVSFERIAARKEVFGDARLAQAISRSNPLVSPDKLKPGITVLKIPLDPENIQGKVVWVDELPDGTILPPPAPSPKPSTPPVLADKTYTTQPSDTLSDISKKFYGKSSLWRTIYQANKSVIPNPDRLAPGVTIRIPPEPVASADSSQPH